MRSYRKPIDSRQISHSFFNNKLSFVYLGLIIFSILICVQMFRWQVINNKKFTAQAEAIVQSKYTITPRRGIIYTKDMTVLSIDEPGWFVYISVGPYKNDKEMYDDQKEKLIDYLVPITGKSKEDLSKLLEGYPVYQPIIEYATENMREALLEQGFTGIYFERKNRRVYPNGKLASNIVGFIGKDENGNEVGNYGISGYYWNDLQGVTGYSSSERDIAGNVILHEEYSPVNAKKGKDIVLTIETPVQHTIEEKLKDGVIQYGADSGTAILMDPNTGAIMAMASYPTYDPNYYTEIIDQSYYKNKAVSDMYEFGSVNKVITISASLEMNKLDTDYICNDTKGYYEMKEFGAKIYTFNKRASGRLDLAGIFRASNNACVAEISQLFTTDEYYQVLIDFGFTKRIGIGLQDESYGTQLDPTKLTKLDIAMASFGQMFSATPLQIISAISAVANDGERMQPYIVDTIISEEGEIKTEPIVASTPISKATANTTAQLLFDATIEMDSSNSHVNLIRTYKVAGKTGTAQIPKVNERGYEDGVTNTTFVGFWPYDQPEYIMLVWLEKPKNHTLAAYNVVPAWDSIFTAIQNDLN